MDFPLDLTKNKFISGMDEFQQDVMFLLKEPVKTFIQDCSIGSYVDVHSSDNDSVAEQVRKTLSELTDVIVKSVQVELPSVWAEVEYKGEIVNFQFNIELS